MSSGVPEVVVISVRSTPSPKVMVENSLNGMPKFTFAPLVLLRNRVVAELASSVSVSRINALTVRLIPSLVKYGSRNDKDNCRVVSELSKENCKLSPVPNKFS